MLISLAPRRTALVTGAAPAEPRPSTDKPNSMGTTLALIRDLWTHVGPGLILALLLPVLAGVLGVVLLQGYRRIRARREQVTESA